MSLADWFITPDALAGGGGQDRLLGLVPLERWPETPVVQGLPPWPLIGLGDPAHPVAALLDAVIEPPVTAESVLRSVCAAPRAAAAAVGLLRATVGLAPRDALTAESLCYAMLQGSAEHVGWLAGRAPSETRPAGRVEIAREGDTLLVEIDRASALNAIDRSIRDGLHDAFMLAEHDPAITAVRLTARGRAFGIGADLTEFGTTRDPATAHLIRMRTLPALPLTLRPGLLEVRVQGACVGASLEIAAFARRIVAKRDAWFQLPELTMGIIPGAGGCVSIPRRIGRQRTALLLLSGRRIDAATALRWGLVDALAGDEGGADLD